MPVTPTIGAELYLDLLKGCLTRSLFMHEGEFWTITPTSRGPSGWIKRRVHEWLRSKGVDTVMRVPSTADRRAEGRDWPPRAETMIGLKRLDNIQRCVTDVLVQGVPGDLIETGVWRGGAAIFMRAILKAMGDTQRVVWAADSFQGLPKPDPSRYPADMDDKHWTWNDQLAISVDIVRGNFAKYGLLDDQVRFLVGWFKDTLPTAPIERLAVMRLDGDMYESTIQALENLYPKLSVGGYAIIDDYGGVPGCRSATDDFRQRHGIKDPLQPVDWTGVFWQRTA